MVDLAARGGADAGVLALFTLGKTMQFTDGIGVALAIGCASVLALRAGVLAPWPAWYGVIVALFFVVADGPAHRWPGCPAWDRPVVQSPDRGRLVSGEGNRATLQAQAVPATTGRWLRLARMAWLLTLLATVGLFAAGIAVIRAEMLTGGYLIYVVGLEMLLVVGFCLIATVLVWRRSDEPMALFAAFVLLTFGGVTYTDTTRALASSATSWWWPRSILACFGWASLFIFFYLFPDGRFVPRWTRLAAVGTGALFVLSSFSPPAPTHGNASARTPLMADGDDSNPLVLG